MKKGGKRSLLICLALLMAASTGCGIGKTTTRGTYQEDEDYLITVAFVEGGQDSQWKTANLESLKSILIEDNGYEFFWEDAKLDQIAQIRKIREYIKEDADYIILDPVVETGWDDVLQEAKDAMVPVIVSNHHIEVEDTSLYQCWIGGDFRKEGETAAKWLEAYLKEEDEHEKNTEKDGAQTDKTIDETQNSDSTEETQQENEEIKGTSQPGSQETEGEESKKKEFIKAIGQNQNDPEEEDEKHYLAVIQGTIGDAMQMGRTEGFGTVAMEHPEWIIAAQQTAEGSRELAKETTKMFLEDNPKIDVIVAESDEMALGAVDAILEMEKTCGPDGEITVLSYGAGSEILEAMKEGHINAAFENDPLIGPRIAEIIQRLESGVSVDKQQYMKGTTIDPSMDLEQIIQERVY